MRQVVRRFGASALVSVLLAGCGAIGTGGSVARTNGGGVSGGVAASKPNPSTTRAPAASTTAPGPAVTGGATATSGVGDWDGTRFDFGHIVSVVNRGGQVVIVFDREQLFTPDGLKSGKELTEEPVRWGNSDVASVNDNPNTRDYVLAPGAEILLLEYPRARCMDMNDNVAPTWQPITPQALIDGAYAERKQVALTFNASGQVSRVRLATSC